MNNKQRLAIVLGLLIAAGCATQPPTQQEVKPTADTTGTEASERTRARLRTELAAGYFERGNLSVALEEVTLALRADPNYSPAYNVAALIHTALKQDGPAEQNFMQALRINPQDADANHNYGWFLCQRKREAEGIKYFLAAVSNTLYQTPERSYLNAALCARAIGNTAGAEEYLRQALQVRPNFVPAFYYLADIAYARGDYLGARKYLGSLTRIASPSPEVLWLGVRVERKLGDQTSEQSYALQLRNRFPDSTQAQALLAGQYE
jgi:type IV pilus assembly protein PilF